MALDNETEKFVKSKRDREYQKKSKIFNEQASERASVFICEYACESKSLATKHINEVDR